METVTIDRFWDLVVGVLTLDVDTVKVLAAGPGTSWLAVSLVLLTGLSQGVAQSVVLFVNQVKPLRFLFSLLIGAVLFLGGYGFWVLSIWILSLLIPQDGLSLERIAQILAFSYAPLLFSLFGAMPYLGVPILRLLSIWNLLAVVVGFATVSDLSAMGAAQYVLLGWVFLQILQQTVGQPMANLGQWIANRAAGVTLVTKPNELQTLIQSNVHPLVSPQVSSSPEITSVVPSLSPLVETLEAAIETLRVIQNCSAFSKYSV